MVPKDHNAQFQKAMRHTAYYRKKTVDEIFLRDKCSKFVHMLFFTIGSMIKDMIGKDGYPRRQCHKLIVVFLYETKATIEFLEMEK